MSATIIELQAENIKRLRAIKIVPKGSTVVVTGKNDQGKSSALDSIDYAFRGKDSICDEPLRTGEKNGSVFLKLSKELESVCTIERIFTPGGTRLVVKNSDGVPQASPQTLLDKIISKITFDPLSFVRTKPMEQMELLRKLVNLDFTKLNADRLRAYEERTVRGRELESAKAWLNGYPFDASIPAEPQSVVELANKLSEVQSVNNGNLAKRTALEKRKKDVQAFIGDHNFIEAEISELEKTIARKREQLRGVKSSMQTAVAEVQTMEKEIATLANLDETKIRSDIAAIQETNAKIEANKRHIQARNEVAKIEKSVVILTSAIQEFDAEKSAQIEFAEFPMPGLSFDEERGVLLNGVPFSQGSSARQLQAAVSIGLALNPQVRVILIRDASLLDDDSMKMVSEAAEKAQAQVWMEVVNSKDPSAIVIEDGEIKV